MASNVDLAYMVVEWRRRGGLAVSFPKTVTCGSVLTACTRALRLSLYLRKCVLEKRTGYMRDRVMRTYMRGNNARVGEGSTTQTRGDVFYTAHRWYALRGVHMRALKEGSGRARAVWGCKREGNTRTQRKVHVWAGEVLGGRKCKLVHG